jgi:DnaK suppressor protein
MARRDELRRLLEERRERIQETVREQLTYCRRERPGHRHADGVDEGEASASDTQEEIDISLIAIQTETIARIDEALTRLTRGDYGQCVACGDAISHARLRALPFAVRCVACEEALEASRRQEPPAPLRLATALDEFLEAEGRLR